MDSEKIITLTEILNKEEIILSQLLELEKNKNKILVSGKYNELEEIVEKEDRLTDTLSELEEKRLSITSDSLSSIFPQNSSSEWTERKVRLTNLLKELKLYNEINQRVLEESIQFFRSSLSILSGCEDDSFYTPESKNSSKGIPLVLDRSI